MIGVVGVVGFLAVFSVMNKNKVSFPGRAGISPSSPVTYTGSVVLRQNGPVAVGKEQPFQIIGDSQGKPVVSYDIVVAYDPAQYTFTSAVSQDPQFQVFTVKDPGMIILTGTRKIGSSAATVWNGSPIASLVFTPKQASVQPISLVSQRGREKTQFVSTNSLAYYPSPQTPVTPPSPQAKTLILPLHRATKIPGTSTFAELTNLTIPGNDCRDCMTTAVVVFTEGDKQQQIQYRTGGFAGYKDVEGNAFGTAYKVIDFRNGSIVVSY